MKSVREFRVRIQIPADKLYSGNNEREREIVEGYYLKKCFRNSYVTKILECTPCSETEIPLYNTRGKGTRTVKIVAECESYPTGKVLVGCRLQPKKTNISTINLVKDHIDIIIRSDANLVPFSEKHMVNILVAQAEYASFRQKVIVAGKLYLYPDDSQTFKIMDELKGDEKQQLIQKLQSNEALLKEISGHKNYKFFYNLVYPYNNFKNEGESVEVLLDDKKPLSGLIVNRPKSVHCMSSNFTYSGSKHYANIMASKFIEYILSTQLEHITMVKNMIDIYAADDKNNELLWKLYKQHKSDQ